MKKSDRVVEIDGIKVAPLGELPVFYLEIGANGDITETNPTTREYIGKDPVGLHLSEIFVDFTGELDPFKLILKEDRTLVNVANFNHSPETLYCTFLRWEDAVIVYGNVDLMEQEQIRSRFLSLSQRLGILTRELQGSNAELDRANKLKSKFLGMAAHDLRKPAANIQGLCELLMDESADPLSPEQSQFIRIIHDESQAMRQLIEDFLDVATVESGKLNPRREEVLLSRILEDTLQVISPYADRKEIAIELAKDPGGAVLFVDKNGIGQVMKNLLMNAVEHSYPHAKVRIDWREREGFFEIDVTDHGVGIPEDVQGKLFEPFQGNLTKKTGNEKSTGLGLSVSKTIAEAHHGRLSFKSEAGSGSTFTLSVPLKD